MSRNHLATLVVALFVVAAAIGPGCAEDSQSTRVAPSDDDQNHVEGDADNADNANNDPQVDSTDVDDDEEPSDSGELEPDVEPDTPDAEPDAEPEPVDAEEDALALDTDQDDVGEEVGEQDVEGMDAPPEPVEPLVIYVAPDGDDDRDGSTEEGAVLTLGRVQQLVEGIGGRDVEVRITAGHYRQQTVVWSDTHPERHILFTRWPLDASERPVFDGCAADDQCPGGTWFQLRHSGGESTNLEFYYIEVRNYSTAISLNGGREQEATSNGGNRIFGCYFQRIGNVFNPSLNPSTAALRLVNSDDNVIENNHFVNVVNTTSGALIHAIYVAHMSDRNRITRNRFFLSSGDPVRLRDYSNDNVINDNRFIQVGTDAGYTDWYCDHDARDDCTKVAPECPSWGNQFRDNLLDGRYDCSPLPTFRYFQDETTTGCTPPSEGARRLRTSGNIQHEPPCGSQ